jgi:diacylglycerol kinase family enzyme
VSLDLLRGMVEDEERRLGWARSRWYFTTQNDAGQAAARSALTVDPDVILVAGGDGTVRAVAEVVGGTVPLALVPAGTGNLLARNLGLPLGDIEESVQVAFAGTTRDVDMATAELERSDGARSVHAFVVMAGIGLDVAMAENTNALAKRHLGWLAYVAPIARSVVANHQFPMRCRVDGRRTRAALAHTIIVGNCGTLTANLLLLPNARIDDGLLDAVVLRPKTAFGWSRIGTRLTVHGLLHKSRFGRRIVQLAPSLKALSYLRGRELVVDFDTPQGVELDGDSFGPVISARLTIHRAGLKVCIRGDKDINDAASR